MKLESESLERRPLNSADSRPHSGATGLVPLLHSGFILTGVANTMVGPLLPLLSSRWHLNDVQAGNLFAAQFLGSMLGVTISSHLVPRWGARVALSAGLLMMASGAIGIDLVTWTLGLLPLFIVGVGLGLTIPTTNILISELYAEKRAAALSLINLSWGIGAAICPFLVAAAQKTSPRFVFLYGLAVLLLLSVVVLARISFSTFPVMVGSTEKGAASIAVWRSRYIPVLGALFFLYVGTEASVGGWIASYAQRVMPAGTKWVITPSYFWGSLLFGRSITPAVLRYLQESKVSIIGLLAALLGIMACLATRNPVQLALSACLAGLGLAAIFPIAIANLSHKFGAAASRVAGLMFNLAGLGGATLPWLVGFTSTRLNNLKFGLFVPLAGCTIMLLLTVLLSAWTASGKRRTLA
jgi:MFS transporter, FHS family, glucose/mannose:H+ symporter